MNGKSWMDVVFFPQLLCLASLLTPLQIRGKISHANAGEVQGPSLC